EDQAKDDKVGALVTLTHKENPEVPPSSSSLSLSSNYGNHFLNLSSDTSLVGTIKETIDTEINSLLDTTPTPTLTTPLPTPPITSKDLTVTTTLLDPLPAIVQRLSDLKRKFKAWSMVYHSRAIEAFVQANVLYKFKNQLPKFLPKAVSNFINLGIESIVRDVLLKNPAFIAKSSSTPSLSSSRAAKSFSKLELKNILFEKIDKI
ncbi:hypothetical protein Tco_1115618, partial [Tanacetum coccineum]